MEQLHNKKASGWIRILIVCTLLYPILSRAKIIPHPLMMDKMILQYGRKVNITGKATDEEQITIRFNGQTKTAQVKDGQWQIQLDRMQPGGPYDMTITGGCDTLTLHDVLVGDVWVISGQSNVYMRVNAYEYIREPYRDYTNPNLRFVSVPPMISHVPLDSFRTKPIDCARRQENRMHIYNRWMDCTFDNFLDFSAAGFMFAVKLQEALDMPVGVIQSAVGNTKIKYWTPNWALSEEEQAKVDPVPSPITFCGMGGSLNPFKHPTYCYNGMIPPLHPFTIQGLIWYQGESDSGHPESYTNALHTLIDSWRSDWGIGDFPWITVQLAAWSDITEPGKGDNVAKIRDAQALSLAKKNTAIVTGVDIGAQGIHDGRKDIMGERLAKAALRFTHNRDIVAAGPWLKKYKIKNNTVILKFSDTGSGLAALDHRYTEEDETGQLVGFAVSEGGETFYPADAVIKGKNQVVVSSPEVDSPTVVRYGYSNRPVSNLYNNEGFAAFPFSTDVKLPGEPVARKQFIK